MDFSRPFVDGEERTKKKVRDLTNSAATNQAKSHPSIHRFFCPPSHFASIKSNPFLLLLSFII
jgi:hypothetical protein